MTDPLPFAIKPLTETVPDADIDGLAALLIDAVDSGASVSFMRGLTTEDARAFWRGNTASRAPRAVTLVARDDEGIAGTVQLQPAWAPNQPHRAEIAKLIVHRRARRRGLGEALMHDIERYAHEAGFTLLTLDTTPGNNAERLYHRLGWTVAGIIPGYALDPDGNLSDTVVFWKRPG